MMRISGQRGIAATHTVVLTTVFVLGACSDRPDREARAAGSNGIALAAATTPTPVSRPEPTAPEPVTAPTPSYENVTYADAEAVFRRGRYAEAAAMLDAFVASNPSSAAGHYLLGLSAWKSGDHAKAEDALVRAVEMDGASVKVRTNLARVLLERGRPLEAVPHLEAALDIDSGAHEVWRVFGNAQAQLGRTDDAIDAYREALLLNESDAWTMNNYGLLLISAGRFEEAVLPLSRAVQLLPGAAVFRNNLGVALEQTGEVDASKVQYEAALAADSTYAKARGSLERVTQRTDGSTSGGYDLDEAASRFVLEMERWMREGEHDC